MLNLIYVYVLLLLIGYLCGNIHGAFIIGKLFRNEDIRNHGSGNSGSTNALRVFGFKLALPAFILDFSKGFFPVFFATNIASFLLSLIGVFKTFNEVEAVMLTTVVAIGVILGHNYPFTLKFKGGKGIASTVGILMAINFFAGLIYGVIILAISFTTRYVSLGSIIASLFIPLLLYIFTQDVNYMILGFMLMVLAIYRHKSNIVRLKNGTENKFGNKEKRVK